MTTTTDVTYEATVGADHTVTVYASRPAGVCGPAETSGPLATLEDVVAFLDTAGYDVAESWRLVNSYEGLWLQARLTRRDTRPAEDAALAAIITRANERAAERITATPDALFA